MYILMCVLKCASLSIDNQINVISDIHCDHPPQPPLNQGLYNNSENIDRANRVIDRNDDSIYIYYYTYITDVPKRTYFNVYSVER